MKVKICFAVAGIILAFWQPGFAAMGSLNYTIPTSVISGGGVPMGSAGFQTNSTLGQPSSITPVSSTNFKVNPGFWYTMIKINCIWDIYNDDDGDVDGLDLNQFLNSYDESDLESFATEFGRTDCSN